MAKKRRKKAKSSKKRRKTSKKRTRKTTKKRTRRSNTIPLKILEKRAGKLVRLVNKRGGTVR